MEKHIVELFRKDDFWYAVLGRNSEEGSFGSGDSISEALRRLAHDIEAKEYGLIAARRASTNGSGTKRDKEMVQQGINQRPY